LRFFSRIVSPCISKIMKCYAVEMKSGLISVVLPVFNEAQVLPTTLRALVPVLDSLDYDYEILFVNDGSKDESFAILSREAALDPRIKVIGFSRNFGHQLAITAGIDFSAGDAVILMDADLQDPPELLPQMVKLFGEGYDIVSPQRLSREGETWFKRKTAALFYIMMRKLVDERLLPEVGDFRLLSRNAVNAIRQFREQHRYMRGLIAWLGLSEITIPFHRSARAAGETKYSLSKMIRLSWTAISSFSALPLRLTMWLGLFTSCVGIGYLIWALYMDVVRKATVWGWTSIVFLQCFFFGVTLICISAIGDYTARIYEESKCRPLYVVGKLVNIFDPPAIGRALLIPARVADPVVVGGPDR
jgi:glycosyltransferase involved in cell wall biosynthesis